MHVIALPERYFVLFRMFSAPQQAAQVAAISMNLADNQPVVAGDTDLSAVHFQKPPNGRRVPPLADAELRISLYCSYFLFIFVHSNGTFLLCWWTSSAEAERKAFRDLQKHYSTPPRARTQGAGRGSDQKPLVKHREYGQCNPDRAGPAGRPPDNPRRRDRASHSLGKTLQCHYARARRLRNRLCGRRLAGLSFAAAPCEEGDAHAALRCSSEKCGNRSVAGGARCRCNRLLLPAGREAPDSTPDGTGHFAGRQTIGIQLVGWI